MTEQTKKIALIVLSIAALVVIALVAVTIVKKKQNNITKQQIISDQVIEEKVLEVEKQPVVPSDTIIEEPEIIIKNGEEWTRDKFGRLVPVKKEVSTINKADIIKVIESQSGTPMFEGEWIVVRKVIRNGIEQKITEKKVFTNGETYEEQLEIMKNILAQDDVLLVEPNYKIEVPKPPVSGSIKDLKDFNKLDLNTQLK